jgi:hypothetical protein
MGQATGLGVTEFFYGLRPVELEILKSEQTFD